MVQLTLPKGSKILEGKTFGKQGKNILVFNIYRWNRESKTNPKLDEYFLEKDKIGPMVLDALLYIKDNLDPSLTLMVIPKPTKRNNLTISMR